MGTGCTRDTRGYTRANPYAKLVGRCTAMLSLCSIAAIMTKMGYLDAGCSVGVDGSLYNVHSVSPWADYCLHGGRESSRS
jgi:hypothetical protein